MSRHGETREDEKINFLTAFRDHGEAECLSTVYQLLLLLMSIENADFYVAGVVDIRTRSCQIAKMRHGASGDTAPEKGILIAMIEKRLIEKSKRYATRVS